MMLRLGIFLAALWPVTLFAQAVVPEVPANVPALMSPSEFEMLLKSLGGDSSLRAMALLAFGVQALLFLLGKTSLMDKLAGKYKLAMVYGLNIVAGVLTLKFMGVSMTAALVHANTLASYQVFLHQVWKQLSEKENG